MVSRRHFLKTAGAFSLGFIGLNKFVGCSRLDAVDRQLLAEGFGALQKDPREILDLPADFSYKVIASAGERMTDGFVVPRKQDGMAALPGPNGRTILICNHEVDADDEAEYGAFGKNYELFNRIDPELVYDICKDDRPCLGGTTTLIYNTQTRELERMFLSLAGTLRNCAGGPTPWNSWVTCEETVQLAGERLSKNHGYNFEVPATATPQLAKPVPLKAMGRFNHEAVAVDPKSGIVYQTEDQGDGLIYRFIPNEPGKLAKGGRLQALGIRGHWCLDTRNWAAQTVFPGQRLEATWIDLDNVDAPEDDLRFRGFHKGAACFARGEGMWYGRNAVYFACTNGGEATKGQIWRYVPSPYEGTLREAEAPGTLELFIEPNHESLVDNCDNVTVTPWGDLILCEDGVDEQYLVGVTPEGKLYKFARNAKSKSELAGVTFSPDGSTLFVNLQRDGLTLAITGPWRSQV